jgi:hypothetical protein
VHSSVEKEVDEPDDAVQGRPQLVGNVCEELRLHFARKLGDLEGVGLGRDLQAELIALPLDLEVSPHSAQELCAVEWLADVVGSSELEPFDDGVFRGLRAEHDHRNAFEEPFSPHLVEHVVARHAGHHDVEQHQVDRRRAEDVEGHGAISDSRHLMRVAQGLPDDFSIHTLVVHDEHVAVRTQFGSAARCCRSRQ